MRNVADVGAGKVPAARATVADRVLRSRFAAAFFWLFSIFSFIETPLGSPQTANASDLARSLSLQLEHGYRPARPAVVVELKGAGVADIPSHLEPAAPDDGGADKQALAVHTGLIVMPREGRHVDPSSGAVGPAHRASSHRSRAPPSA